MKMVASDFVKCVAMLRIRFGDKAFDKQFNEILMKLVIDMDAKWFSDTCIAFVGERKHTNPPLIVNFREAMHKEKNRVAETRSWEYNRLMASNERGEPGSDGGWSRVTEVLGNVKNGWEAVQVLNQKKKVNIAQGKDEYDGLELFRCKK